MYNMKISNEGVKKQKHNNIIEYLIEGHWITP